MPGGRPTKWKDEYCELIVEFMGQGYSFEAFCGHIGITTETGYQWVKKKPEFSDAKKRAVNESRIFWEKLGIGGTVGKIKGFNCAAWIFNMKNRFGWRDRQETEISGANITVSYQPKSKREDK